MNVEAIITLAISIVALIASVVALIYTALTFLLKSGMRIRGSFGVCSSIVCEDHFISTLTLQNLKDRAAVIFKIYIKIGHNFFLEVEDFEDQPLIIQPFEAYNKQYEPVDHYKIGLKRVDLNELLSNRKIRSQIILSTPDGRYRVSSHIHPWHPVHDLFSNGYTGIIKPYRTIYKDTAYGSNAQYVIELKFQNGREEIIPVYPRDYTIRKFRNFQLTQESLHTKEKLEEYLYDQVGKGLLDCAEILVYDLAAWRDEVYGREIETRTKLSYCNWFKYRIVGKIATIINHGRMRRENALLKKKRMHTKQSIGIPK